MYKNKKYKYDIFLVFYIIFHHFSSFPPSSEKRDAKYIVKMISVKTYSVSTPKC